MNFEQFSGGGSVLHTRDARVKVIGGTALILVTALCRSFYTAVPALICSLLFISLARPPVSRVAMRLALVNTFILFLWLTLPLSYPGAPLFTLGRWSISEQGVALAGLITLKANSIVLFVIALFATSTIAELGHGLNRLKLPSKLCLLLLFSYRYIFVINQEYLRLVRAAKLRSFRPGTNLHTYRTYGYLFGMTLLQSKRRAERVQQAMVLRGFHGQFHPLHQSVITAGDRLFLFLSLTLSLVLAATELFNR